MKLTTVFKYIKEKLENIEEIKLLTWWNGQQSENIIHVTPAVYIEFAGNFNTNTLGGGVAQLTEPEVSLSLVSKLLSKPDGAINTDVVEKHEILVQKIYEALQAESDENICGQSAMKFNRTKLSFDMNRPGMAITSQTFKFVLYLPTQKRDRKKINEFKINA